MATSTFDTLAYAKKLKAAGVPEEQAEVQAETFAEIIEERLATKCDIDLLRRDMKEMEPELKKDIVASKSETIKWIAGMLYCASWPYRRSGKTFVRHLPQKRPQAH